MFTVRNQQVETLTVSLREQSNARLAVYAKERFPRKFAHSPGEDLSALARRVRKTANLYGIERENDVATFLDLTVMYGDDFHHAPWATSVLSNEAMHGPDKMAMLRYQVRLTGVDL
jgi:hypothetical protein